MTYSVLIRGKGNNHRELKETLLDGLYPVEQMTAELARSLDLCRHCPLDCHNHPQVWIKAPVPSSSPYWGHGMCTVLFHDVLKPSWKPEDLI